MTSFQNRLQTITTEQMTTLSLYWVAHCKETYRTLVPLKQRVFKFSFESRHSSSTPMNQSKIIQATTSSYKFNEKQKFAQLQHELHWGEGNKQSIIFTLVECTIITNYLLLANPNTALLRMVHCSECLLFLSYFIDFALQFQSIAIAIIILHLLETEMPIRRHRMQLLTLKLAENFLCMNKKTEEVDHDC